VYVYTCTVQYTATTVYLRIRTYESTVQTIFFGECGIQYNIRSQSQSGKLTDWRFLGLPHSARHIHRQFRQARAGLGIPVFNRLQLRIGNWTFFWVIFQVLECLHQTPAL
jgi:hypothetical protein